MDDGARKGQQLALTCREVVTTLANFLIKAVCQFADKVVGIDVLASLHDLLVSKLVMQNNVATDCACKQENVLQHLTEVLAQ